MTDPEKTQIIDELVGAVQNHCDTLIALIDEHRKNTIGILQALRNELEKESIDNVLKNADKTNRTVDSYLKSLEKEHERHGVK